MGAEKNPMKERLKSCYIDMILAREYYRKIMKALRKCDGKKIFNIEIVYFIKNVPRFKNFTYLNKQIYDSVKILKQVCLNEIDNEMAYKILEKDYSKLLETMICINEYLLLEE